MNNAAIVSCSVAAMLFIGNIMAAGMYRVEMNTVPVILHGDWHADFGDSVLNVDEKYIQIMNTDSMHGCTIEKIIQYKNGFFSGYLFGEPRFALVCDAASTKENMPNPSIVPPDYRKTYHITMPDIRGCVDAEHSVYMSKGYAGSEGNYVWNLGYFCPMS